MGLFTKDYTGVSLCMQQVVRNHATHRDEDLLERELVPLFREMHMPVRGPGTALGHVMMMCRIGYHDHAIKVCQVLGRRALTPLGGIARDCGLVALKLGVVVALVLFVVWMVAS